MNTDRIADELYEALRSMAESYDFATAMMPPGVARDSLAGYFIGTQKPASEALEKYARFKVIKAQIVAEDYRINLFSHDSTITGYQS